MAVFPKFKITNKGLDLLNRSIAEKKALTFTKFKIGNGVPSGNWEELNDIVAKFKEFPVLETSVQPNKVVRVKGYFDNKGLAQDYLLKEIGVFATLEGVAGEVLYSYTNAGDTADTIPDENNGFFSRTFDVSNYISNATQVTFQVIEQRFDFNFNTVEEMKNATFLKAGDRLHLWGNTQLGDITTKTLIVADSYSGTNTKYTLKNGKIAIVINDIDSKLDRGTYQGNAQDLKDEIDGKVSKSGDTITGKLIVNDRIYTDRSIACNMKLNSTWVAGLEAIYDGERTSMIGFYNENGILDYTYLGGVIGEFNMKLYANGNAYIKAKNLKTNSKEIVEAINENKINIDTNMGTTQNGNFPLSKAIVGNTYRASNGKLYKCIKTYDGSLISVPNSNFEELSIYKNFNRLEKLSGVFKYDLIYDDKQVLGQHNLLPGKKFSSYDYLLINGLLSSGSSDRRVVPSVLIKTSDFKLGICAEVCVTDIATKYQYINDTTFSTVTITPGSFIRTYQIFGVNIV